MPPPADSPVLRLRRSRPCRRGAERACLEDAPGPDRHLAAFSQTVAASSRMRNRARRSRDEDPDGGPAVEDRVMTLRRPRVAHVSGRPESKRLRLVPRPLISFLLSTLEPPRRAAQIGGSVADRTATRIKTSSASAQLSAAAALRTGRRAEYTAAGPRTLRRRRALQIDRRLTMRDVRPQPRSARRLLTCCERSSMAFANDCARRAPAARPTRPCCVLPAGAGVASVVDAALAQQRVASSAGSRHVDRLLLHHPNSRFAAVDAGSSRPQPRRGAAGLPAVPARRRHAVLPELPVVLLRPRGVDVSPSPVSALRARRGGAAQRGRGTRGLAWQHSVQH